MTRSPFEEYSAAFLSLVYAPRRCGYASNPDYPAVSEFLSARNRYSSSPVESPRRSGECLSTGPPPKLSSRTPCRKRQEEMREHGRLPRCSWTLAKQSSVTVKEVRCGFCRLAPQWLVIWLSWETALRWTLLGGSRTRRCGATEPLTRA